MSIKGRKNSKMSGSDFAKFQRDSYCVECDVKVVSCEPAKVAPGSKGKKGKKGGNAATSESNGQTAYDVVLEDTILFAEAGGQPSDHGTIDGKPVVQVRVREGTRGNNPFNIVHTLLVCCFTFFPSAPRLPLHITTLLFVLTHWNSLRSRWRLDRQFM